MNEDNAIRFQSEKPVVDTQKLFRITVEEDVEGEYLEQFPSQCAEFYAPFGMKAYSLDLRERIAAACAEPKARIYQVAAQFRVSISFVDKLLHRQRTSGSLAALPARGGPAPRLDPSGGVQLAACLGQQPDATLCELCAALVGLGGPALSRSAMGRAVIWLGWDRKKKASTRPSAAPSAW